MVTPGVGGLPPASAKTTQRSADSGLYGLEDRSAVGRIEVDLGFGACDGAGMRSSEEFAAALVRKYPHETMAARDLEAGECEVAAISIVEASNVTVEEMVELGRLCRDFDEVDRRVAATVLAKRRMIR